MVIPLLSKSVLDEYRAVLSDEDLVRRFPQITPTLIEITLRRLRFVSDFARSPQARFSFPRDPRDEKFIELAIELRATHVISADSDLLSLARSRSEAFRRLRQRLPGAQIMSAAAFLRTSATGAALD